MVAALCAAVVIPAGAQGATTRRAARAAAATAHGTILRGRVSAGGRAARGFTVTAWRPGGRSARLIARATTSVGGAFALRLPQRRAGTLYLTAHPRRRPALTLLTLLTSATAPRAVIDERTTVAGAFAAARFVQGKTILGRAPGLPNAFATAATLINPASGAVAHPLATPPNGSETTTLATLDTLADAVSGCFRGSDPGCRHLRAAAGGTPDVVGAVAGVARAPYRSVSRIFALATARTFHPRLKSPPAAWTLSLLHTGGGLDGPGRIAFNAHGDAWVTNNFTGPGTQAGLGVTVLGPTGRPIDGSPVHGGGVEGAWWGMAIDRRGHAWVSSYVGADTDSDFTGTSFQGGDAVSEFAASGVPISPASGYTAGGLRAPQGIAVDRFGNVWIADHGGNAVTEYPGGDPARARMITGGGIYKPFAIEADAHGNIWVDNGALSSTPGSLTRIDQAGTPTGPIAGGMSSPQGLAIDREGDVWAAQFTRASIARVTPNAPVGSSRSPGGADMSLFTTVSMRGPWGVAIDGNDNVWVAGFLGETLTELCGTARQDCPAGARTGTAISPAAGYSNGGLEHVTSVQVDESGDVWLANNWHSIVPISGGNSLVEFIGLAGPVRTPLIGPPQSP